MGPTNISYATRTWSPTTGCSNGCPTCWARGVMRRRPEFFGGDFSPREWPDRLSEPSRAQKPQEILTSFMGDLFDPAISPRFIERVFAAINGSYDSGRFRYSDHTFVVLTRRPERMRDFLNDWLRRGENGDSRITFPFPPRNVWLGTTITKRADLDGLDVLRQTLAAHRWVSFEPLLDDLGEVNLDGIDQVIVGCESGSKRRPMMPHWWDDLREQCVEAGVPVFLKQQTGKWDVDTWYPSEDGKGKVHHFDPKPGELAWR